MCTTGYARAVDGSCQSELVVLVFNIRRILIPITTYYQLFQCVALGTLLFSPPRKFKKTEFALKISYASSREHKACGEECKMIACHSMGQSHQRQLF
jgi:hypothetical protein